jgi:hypothetical protein
MTTFSVMEGEEWRPNARQLPLEIKAIVRMLLSYRPQPTKSCAAWPRNILEGNVLVILCNRQPCCTKLDLGGHRPPLQKVIWRKKKMPDINVGLLSGI